MTKINFIGLIYNCMRGCSSLHYDAVHNRAKKAPSQTGLLITVLILVNIAQNEIFGGVIGGLAGNYGLPFAAWILVAGYVWWLPRVKHHGKIRFQRLLGWLAFMCLLIAALGIMLQGAMSGFGKSPYDRSVIGIILNCGLQATVILGTEMSRAWLMNRHFARRPLVGIPMISVGFTLLNFRWSSYLNISDGLSAVKFIGSEFLPSLSQNILATYFAFLGGPLPAVIYRGGISLIERTSPVLPVSNWVGQTLIGVLAPILGLILVREIFREENRLVKRGPSGEDHLGWVMTSFAAVLIMWFGMGVFTYMPKVILTGSMQPGIKIGDVVLVHRLPEDQVRNEVRVGDIIMFLFENNMKVTHRVMKIADVQGKKYYTTKGDANPGPDKPTSEGNVLGKVVMVIPKMGLLSMLVNGGINFP